MIVKKEKQKTTIKIRKRKDIQVENENQELEVIDKTNYRHFMILLYEDTSTYDYNLVLQTITTFKKYAYIKHYPESSEKKQHIHVILSLENKTSISSISKKIGVPKQFIQSINDMRQSCRYLIHLGWEDKIPYSLDSVIVSDGFRKEFFKAFDDIETDDIVIDKIRNKIISLASNYNNTIDLEFALIKYLSIEGYTNIYKKYKDLFNKFITTLFNNESYRDTLYPQRTSRTSVIPY